MSASQNERARNRRRDDKDANREQGVEKSESYLTILQATYADILFVLLPFLVLAMFQLWKEDSAVSILMDRDLSVAAAMLAGLAIVKLLVGLLTDTKLMERKEQFIFLIAGAIFMALVPALFVSVIIMLSQDEGVPGFVGVFQPLVLLMAIGVYTGSVVATKGADEQRELEPGTGEEAQAEAVAEAPEEPSASAEEPQK